MCDVWRTQAGTSLVQSAQRVHIVGGRRRVGGHLKRRKETILSCNLSWFAQRSLKPWIVFVPVTLQLASLMHTAHE